MQESTTPTETLPEAIERLWIYAGQRLGKDGKLSHVWRDHDGELRWYDKLEGRSIGAAYRIWQPAAKPDSVFTKGSYEPRFVGRDEANIDMATVRQWEIDNRLDTTLKASKAAEKREAQVSELRQALQPIRARYRASIASRERAALLALVIQEITG